MQSEGLNGIVGVLIALVFVGIFLERESTRPDALVRAIYLREGLLALERLAVAIGIASPALGGVGPFTYLLIWAAAAFAILRPSHDTGGRNLWLFALAVPVTAVVTDLLIADINREPRTLQSQLTFALLVTALWRAPRLDAEVIIRYAKLVIGFMLVTSVVLIAMRAPGAVNVEGPVGRIPYIGRWAGIFPHANSYGPAGVYYLVLEWLQPSRLRYRVPMIAAAFAAIVLSQSMTNWGGALIVLSILAVAGWSQRRAIYAVLLAGTLAIIGTMTLDVEPTAIDETGLGTITTLTGRTWVWGLGIERWQESPWIGAGSGVFRDIAQRTGADWAGQAHNAYVAALAEHGVVGLLAVLGYLGALGAVAWRHARATRNGSLALFGALLARTITETPLMHLGYEELTILALAFAWSREPPAMVAERPSWQVHTDARSS